MIISESKVVVTTEPKNKKSQRSYFSKNFKVTYERTHLLDSLLNIIKSIKSENFNIEEVQKDTSYHMIPILFSTQENFISCLNNESKLFLITIKILH